MTKMYHFISRLYDRKVDASGLAMFRILYGFVLLMEVRELLVYKELVFDSVPFLVPCEILVAPFLVVWIMVILLIILGLFTKTATIVNYVLTLVVFSTTHTWEYHLDYAMTGLNLLLTFYPISQTFSLDRLLLKLKHSNTKSTYVPSDKIPLFYYHFLVLLGVALIYFDSIFFKFSSPMWRAGLGMWQPAVLPFTTWLDLSFIMNQKWFAIGLGYITFSFELIFLFFYSFKRSRIPLLILGLGLHVGISLAFPLPWFGLGEVAVYLSLVPFFIYRWFFEKIKLTSAKITFFYDELCPLCNRTRIIIKHFDAFNAIHFLGVQSYASKYPALANYTQTELLANVYSIDNKTQNVHMGIDTYRKVFQHIWFLFPIAILFYIPGFYHLGKAVYNYIANNRERHHCDEKSCDIGLPTKPVDYDQYKLLQNLTFRDVKLSFYLFLLVYSIGAQLFTIAKSHTKFLYKIPYSNQISHFNRIVFGITPHPVFMHTHFYGYNHEFAVVYVDKAGKETWLPLIDENGQCCFNIWGRRWVNWTFRVSNPKQAPERIEKGVRSYTSFWAHKNNISLDDAKFLIKVKKIDTVTDWEYDFLHRQMQHPWLDGGYVQWSNKTLTPYIKDIESL